MVCNRETAFLGMRCVRLILPRPCGNGSGPFFEVEIFHAVLKTLDGLVKLMFLHVCVFQYILAGWEATRSSESDELLRVTRGLVF